MFDPTSHMPEALQQTGPLDVLWWQWIALPVLVFVAFVLGSILGRVSRWLLTRVALRTDATWDDAILLALADPMRWAWTLLLFRATTGVLELHPDVERGIRGVTSAFLFLCFFWFVLRVLDQSQRILGGTAWAKDKPIARSLVPLAVRVTKVVVLIIGLISMLSQLGYPVAGLIAGLGIGGIAIALAAQKTVENLFGAFAIGLDQPFREGDAVKIAEFTGTVESIGLRSTRIRTADRTVVTIPNAQVAESKVESFAERDRLRLFLKLGLVYETTGAGLRGVLDGLRTVLREHPHISDEGVDVRFVGLGASSLDLEVAAWFDGVDNETFRATREQLLMTFIEIVERHGSALAFPTQTVHVVGTAASAQA